MIDSSLLWFLSCPFKVPDVEHFLSQWEQLFITSVAHNMATLLYSPWEKKLMSKVIQKSSI